MPSPEIPLPAEPGDNQLAAPTRLDASPAIRSGSGQAAADPVDPGDAGCRRRRDRQDRTAARPNDLAALIRDACERQQKVAPNCGIEGDLDRLLPLASCDGNLIDQVTGNLLPNPARYSSRTQKVEISGRTEGNTAVISVTGHGVGIAPEGQPLIFERLFRGHNASGIGGTGIGLTLARYIIDLHGGDISVRSTLGTGSTFTVRLPIA